MEIAPNGGNAGSFEAFFKQGASQQDVAQRGAFLSRLFGIFNEKVVMCWCSCEQAPYKNLGRPTLRKLGQPKPYFTLDFTFQSRTTQQVYVAEMKCEIQFESYRYLQLTDTSQLEHHLKAPSSAFHWLTQLAQAPDTFETYNNAKLIKADGAILIWGSVSPQGRAAVREKYGFADVLSIEDMVRDLRQWRSTDWQEQVAQLRGWSNQLFDFLV